MPVLKLFLAPSLYALIIPAYFLAGVLRRKKALLPVLAPVIVTFLGLLISPMVQPNPETMRYLMPFVYTTPVLLCIETDAGPHLGFSPASAACREFRSSIPINTHTD